MLPPDLPAKTQYPPTISKSLRLLSTTKQTCFVIMPFSQTTSEHTEDYWTTHFDKVLKPLIEENSNLAAHRSTPLRGDVLRQIITDLVTSPIVVADLTDARPNVYWELGVRQSFKHGTITIAQKGTSLPFDLAAKGTLFYDVPPSRLEDFRKRFKQALSDCLEHPNIPDSHVLETISGRGSLYQILRRQEIIRRLDALINTLKLSVGLIDSIQTAATNNLHNPRKSIFPTSRFQLSTLELLHTNRYLDVDDPFYAKVDLLLLQLSTCNDQLNLWETHREPINDWMLNKFIMPGKFGKFTVKDLMLKLGEELQIERQRLASQR